MRRRLPRAGAVLLVAGLVLAACSPGDDAADLAPDDPAGTSTTEAPTTTTTLPLPQPPPLRWAACGGGFECGTLTVPVDYAAPAGETLHLSVIKRPADDPEARIGTLVMNPGGPGASGVRRVRRGFTVSPEVAERFDIVSFDPRGVGGSTPITCGSTVPAFRAVDHAPTTPEEQQALEAAAKAVGDECAATEGVRIGHLGTFEVVRDVEVLRLALGEPTISFVGISYGTAIGLLWAEAYPSSVRAMVLDGVEDPNEATTASDEEQLDAIDATFDAIASACAADADCPTTRDGGVAVAYDRLVAQMVAAGGTLDGVGLTQLRYAVFMATYGSEHWPRLWQALHDGLQGDLDGIAAMSTSFTNLVAYAPFAIVTCLDAPHPVGPAQWRRDAEEAAKDSPRFGAALSNELLPCAYLPNSDLDPHEVRAPGTPPILVVGSTGDVATPYAQAVAVADHLDAGVLLTVEIDGHVALGASDCADAAITRYLVDGTLPAAGSRC